MRSAVVVPCRPRRDDVEGMTQTNFHSRSDERRTTGVQSSWDVVAQAERYRRLLGLLFGAGSSSEASTVNSEDPATS